MALNRDEDYKSKKKKRKAPLYSHFSVKQYMNAPHVVRHPRTPQTSPVTLSTLITYTISIRHISLSDLVTSDIICLLSA